MLAALERVRIDTQQGQEARHRGADAVAQRVAVGQDFRGRRGQRAQHAERAPGVAARRVQRQIGGVPQAADAVGVLSPLGQSLAPALGGLSGELIGREPFAHRLGRVHPGSEVLGAQLRKGEEEVAQVALRVDGDGRHAVERGLLQQGDAQAGLAAARHPHAQRVGGEILRLVEERLVASLPRLRVEYPAEVEHAQLVEVVHRRPPLRAPSMAQSAAPPGSLDCGCSRRICTPWKPRCPICTRP